VDEDEQDPERKINERDGERNSSSYSKTYGRVVHKAFSTQEGRLRRQELREIYPFWRWKSRKGGVLRGRSNKDIVEGIHKEFGQEEKSWGSMGRLTRCGTEGGANLTSDSELPRGTGPLWVREGGAVQ